MSKNVRDIQCQSAWLLDQKGIKLESDERIDPLCGDRWIIQRKRGHRAATDDQLLAWGGINLWEAPFEPSVLDLGSGKGTVSLILSAYWSQAYLIGIEAFEQSYRIALKNRDLNELKDQFFPLLGDLRDPHILKQGCSLIHRLRPTGEIGFDLIVGAPPFMPLGSGVLPQDPQRATGRFELRGGLEAYLEAMESCLKKRSTSRALLLLDGASEARTLTAINARSEGLKLVKRWVIRPRPGSPATYHLFGLEPNLHTLSSEHQTIEIVQREGHQDQWSRPYQSMIDTLQMGSRPTPWVVIPARLGSTRLPRKPLADLGGKALIARVVEAVSEVVAPQNIIVASDSQEILKASEQPDLLPGYQALIDTPCQSGSQRVARAIEYLSELPKRDWVINVQGDEPRLPASALHALISSLPYFTRRGIRIVTLASALPKDERSQQAILADQSIVKVGLTVLRGTGQTPIHPAVNSLHRALTFTRHPTGTHIHTGVYAFYREALSLVDLPTGPLALQENLEQLTWMEAGEEIGVVCLHHTPPHGIDTPNDLVEAQRAFNH